MRRAVLLLCALAFAAPAYTPAHADWQRVFVHDGIEVSQQPVAGRQIPMFRAVGEVDADPDQILEVLQAVEQHTQWMPDLAVSQRLKESEDTNTLWVYRVQEAPWPVSDRDVVLQSQLEVVEAHKDLRIRFHAVNIDQIPPRRGMVRIPHLIGHYRIQGNGDGKSRVEYEVDLDLGGNLPAWLAARVGRDNPVRTLMGLRAMLRKPARSAGVQ